MHPAYARARTLKLRTKHQGTTVSSQLPVSWRGPAQHHHELLQRAPAYLIETPAQKVPPRGLAPPTLDH